MHERVRTSLQLGVFRLGLLEDRDVWVGVFPKSQEILIGSLGLGLIFRQSQRSAQLHVRQCAYGIADHNPAMTQNLLEFRGGCGSLAQGEIGLPANIDRIERSEESMKAATRCAQVIGDGYLQQIYSLLRLAMVQCQKGADCGLSPRQGNFPFHGRLVALQKGDVVALDQKVGDLQLSRGGLLKGVRGIPQTAKVFIVEGKLGIADGRVRIDFDNLLVCLVSQLLDLDFFKSPSSCRASSFMSPAFLT